MVTDGQRWAPDPGQFVRRLGNRVDPRTSRVGAPSVSDEARRRYEDTGLTWDDFDVDEIPESEIERSRHRFRAHLPDLIWNTAALEGNTFTLPEVRTLLDGVTVGGKRLHDEQQIIALSEAYNRLDEMVGSREFALTKNVTDELHGLVARNEALESGHFRGEGSASGGGHVSLANGGRVEGTDHGEGGELLRQHFADLAAYLDTIEDPRRRALVYFASATRRQFYFDGNKRTARLMMTGELMSSGFDIVSIPFIRRLEFNNALDTLFSDDNGTTLLRFLASCAVD